MSTSFDISRGTPDDIPGMVDVWYKAFNDPGILTIFPDSLSGREWITKSISQMMNDEKKNTVYMIITENSKEDTAKGKVVAYSQWIVHPGGGPIPPWHKRWIADLPEDMKEEVVDGIFFQPMARQHAAVTGERPHYFLEVLATHEDYRKRGFGSRLVEWGCDEADRHALESYLDAAPSAKAIYEKFGFVEQAEQRDSKALGAPLLRPARK